MTGPKRIVIALGGNALMSPGGVQSIKEEQSKLSTVATRIATMAKEKGMQLVITHGNGTQVGDELIKNIVANQKLTPMPLALMTAETQASIGSIAEMSLNSKCETSSRKFATVVTHVVVKKSDKSFNNPTKPIGPAFTAGQIKAFDVAKKYHYSKFGNKYRITVPSPRPVNVVETPIIKRLLNHTNVICCGGGGIPVSVSRGSYSFEDAVIDKDYTSSLIAREIGANMLVILTDVDYVYEDFPRNKIPIKSAKASEIMKSIDKFAEGSIGPKIEACAEFAASGAGIGVIGSLEKLDRVMRLESGTVITK